MTKQKILICKSSLTNEYYRVTKYIDYGNGNIQCINKYPATKEEIADYELECLVKNLEKKGVK